MPGFELDSQLESDSIAVAESELCLLRLLNDARYAWLLLIPKRQGICEVFELDEAEQLQLARETSAAAAAIKQSFACDKINVAAIGNIVRQLHIHVVARNQGDPAWPGPVWGHSPRMPYSEGGHIAMRSKLRASAIRDWFSFE